MRLQSSKVARSPNVAWGRMIAAIAFATLAHPCQAGTSAPFDVGGLLPYAIGLLVLVVLSVRSRTARYVTYAWVAIPLILLLAGEALDHAQVKHRTSEDPMAAARAHSGFCQSRKPLVVSQIKQQSGAAVHSVLFRVDSAFTQDQRQLNAAAVADRLQRSPIGCSSTGLSSVESLLPNESGMAIHFPACSGAPAEKIKTAPSVAQYELIVGETVRKVWTRANSHDAVTAASIRIADRKSDQTLAIDTMYFLNTGSGSTNCPNAEDQLMELIERAFSSARERTRMKQESRQRTGGSGF